MFTVSHCSPPRATTSVSKMLWPLWAQQATQLVRSLIRLAKCHFGLLWAIGTIEKVLAKPSLNEKPRSLDHLHYLLKAYHYRTSQSVQGTISFATFKTIVVQQVSLSITLPALMLLTRCMHNVLDTSQKHMSISDYKTSNHWCPSLFPTVTVVGFQPLGPGMRALFLVPFQNK